MDTAPFTLEGTQLEIEWEGFHEIEWEGLHGVVELRDALSGIKIATFIEATDLEETRIQKSLIPDFYTGVYYLRIGYGEDWSITLRSIAPVSF